jgi:predicted nuclease with TOPRIM domain
VERARWTDERLDDRMSAIDTSFERVFQELRAERVLMRSEMGAERAELRTEMRATRAELNERLTRLDDRLTRLDDRLSQLGFRAAGILAAGLIALVATQL